MDLGLLAERGEAAAYVDLFRAAPGPLAETLGLEVHAIGDATALLAPRMDAPEFNRVLGLGLDAPATEAHLDEIVGRFRPLGLTKARLQLAPRAVPGQMLPTWLAARALHPAPGGWTKRARATDAHSAATTDLAMTDAAELPGAFGAVVCRGFGMPEVLTPWLDALVGRPDWRCFLALDGEQPVAAAALYLGEEYGWLGIGTTLPQARRRGAHGALMGRRIAAAAKAGKAWAITETGAPAPGEAPGPSYRNMDRMGFAEAHLRRNYLL